MALVRLVSLIAKLEFDVTQKYIAAAMITLNFWLHYRLRIVTCVEPIIYYSCMHNHSTLIKVS